MVLIVFLDTLHCNGHKLVPCSPLFVEGDLIPNGGMEEQYGLDLKLEEDGTYRTMTFDDYPVYYEMGEKTLPLADGVVLKDSSADPQAEELETTGASAVAAAVNADPDNWTVYNTTLVVQGGRVQEVRRIWVP